MDQPRQTGQAGGAREAAQQRVSGLRLQPVLQVPGEGGADVPPAPAAHGAEYREEWSEEESSEFLATSEFALTRVDMAKTTAEYPDGKGEREDVYLVVCVGPRDGAEGEEEHIYVQGHYQYALGFFPVQGAGLISYCFLTLSRTESKFSLAWYKKGREDRPQEEVVHSKCRIAVFGAEARTDAGSFLGREEFYMSALIKEAAKDPAIQRELATRLAKVAAVDGNTPAARLATCFLETTSEAAAAGLLGLIMDSANCMAVIKLIIATMRNDDSGHDRYVGRLELLLKTARDRPLSRDVLKEALLVFSCMHPVDAANTYFSMALAAVDSFVESRSALEFLIMMLGDRDIIGNQEQTDSTNKDLFMSTIRRLATRETELSESASEWLRKLAIQCKDIGFACHMADTGVLELSSILKGADIGFFTAFVSAEGNLVKYMPEILRVFSLASSARMGVKHGELLNRHILMCLICAYYLAEGDLPGWRDATNRLYNENNPRDIDNGSYEANAKAMFENVYLNHMDYVVDCLNFLKTQYTAYKEQGKKHPFNKFCTDLQLTLLGKMNNLDFCNEMLRYFTPNDIVSYRMPLQKALLTIVDKRHGAPTSIFFEAVDSLHIPPELTSAFKGHVLLPACNAFGEEYKLWVNDGSRNTALFGEKPAYIRFIERAHRLHREVVQQQEQSDRKALNTMTNNLGQASHSIWSVIKRGKLTVVEFEAIFKGTAELQDLVQSHAGASEQEFGGTQGELENLHRVHSNVIKIVNKFNINVRQEDLLNTDLSSIRDAITHDNKSALQDLYKYNREYLTDFVNNSYWKLKNSTDKETLELLRDAREVCERVLNRILNGSITVEEFNTYSDKISEADAKVFRGDEGQNVLNRMGDIRKCLLKREGFTDLLAMMKYKKLNPEGVDGISGTLRSIDNDQITVMKLESSIATIERTRVDGRDMQLDMDVLTLLSNFKNIEIYQKLLARLDKEKMTPGYANACLSASGMTSNVPGYFMSLEQLNRLMNERGEQVKLKVFIDSIAGSTTFEALVKTLKSFAQAVMRNDRMSDLGIVSENIEEMYRGLKKYLQIDMKRNLEEIDYLIRKDAEVRIEYNGDYIVVSEGSNTFDGTKYRIQELLVSASLISNDNGEVIDRVGAFKRQATSLGVLAEKISTAHREGFEYFCKRSLSDDARRKRYAAIIQFSRVPDYLRVLEGKLGEWKQLLDDLSTEGHDASMFRAIPRSLIYYILYLAASKNEEAVVRHKLNIQNYLGLLGIEYNTFISKLREGLRSIVNWNDIVLDSEENLKDENIKIFEQILDRMSHAFTPREDKTSPLALGKNNMKHIRNFKKGRRKVLYYSVESSKFPRYMNFFRYMNKANPRFYEWLECNADTEVHHIDTFIDSCRAISLGNKGSLHIRFIINPNNLKTDVFGHLAKAFNEFVAAENGHFIILQLQDSGKGSDRDFAGTLPEACRVGRVDIKNKKLSSPDFAKVDANKREVEIVRSQYCGEGKTTYIEGKAGKREDPEGYVLLNVMDADREADLIARLQQQCKAEREYSLHVVLTLSFGKLAKFIPFIYQLVHLDYICVNGTLFSLRNVKRLFIECREYTYNLADILGIQATEIKYSMKNIDNEEQQVKNFVNKYSELALVSNGNNTIVSCLSDLFKIITLDQSVTPKQIWRDAEQHARAFLKGIRSYRMLHMYVKLMNSNYEHVRSFAEFIGRTSGEQGNKHAIRKITDKFSKFFFRMIHSIVPINERAPKMEELCNMESFQKVVERTEGDMNAMIPPEAIIWVRGNYVLPPLMRNFNTDSIDITLRSVLTDPYNHLSIDKIKDGERICGFDNPTTLSKYLFKEIAWTMGAQGRFFKPKARIFTENPDKWFKDWKDDGKIEWYVLNEEGEKLLENYVFTLDNTIKMLFIYLKMINRLPVVLIGETGVGKTELLNKIRDISGLPMQTVQVHSETRLEEIKAVLTPAPKEAGAPLRFVFFDEANTSPHIQKIEELVISRTFCGEPIPDNLSFLVAVNPYRMLNDRERALYADFKNPRAPVVEGAGEPAYTVRALPLSFQQIAFNFGDLDLGTYCEYGKCIMKSVLGDDRMAQGALDLSMKAIRRTKEFMMNEQDLVVSLRELDRMRNLTAFFLKDRRFATAIKGDKKRAIAMALYIVFALRLPHKLRQEYTAAIDAVIGDGRYMLEKTYKNVRDAFLSEIKVPKKIALNDSLKGNLFSMILAVLTRIPLIIIGKPGTSKSLGMLILDKITNGNEDERLAGLPATRAFTYQGSKSSTATDIERLHEVAVHYAEGNDKMLDPNQRGGIICCEEYGHVTIFQFDEIGLAEQGGKRNALKCLHYILEVKDPEARYHEVGDAVFSRVPAFIGISNYALDQAKTNRCLIFCKGDLDKDDLRATANGIAKNFSPQYESMGGNIPYLEQLIKGYQECIAKQRDKELNIIGLRNFYSLITDILKGTMRASGANDERGIGYYIKKSFDIYTSPEVTFNPYRYFNQELEPQGVPKIRPLTMNEEVLLVNSNLSSKTGRHIMFLVDNMTTVQRLITTVWERMNIVATSRGVKTTMMMPTKDENFVTKSINEIINIMSPEYEQENGQQIVFMLKCDEVYPSLFALLNRNYTSTNNKMYVKLALKGSGERQRPVSKFFRVFTILFQDEVNKVDPAFINRFEMRNMTTAYERDTMLTQDENRFKNCRDLVKEASSIISGALIQNKIRSDEASPFLSHTGQGEQEKAFDIEKSIALFTLTQKYIDNGDYLGLRNELLMLLGPGIRMEFKTFIKRKYWAMDIISLRDAMMYCAAHPDRLTPVTVVLVDVYKTPEQVAEMCESGGTKVLDRVYGKSDEDEDCLMKWGEEDDVTVRVLVVDYTKSAYAMVNLASLQFHKTFPERKLVIVAKLVKDNIGELYAAPSEVMSYWCVSTDYMDTPFFVAAYRKIDVYFTSGFMHVLPKVLADAYTGRYSNGVKIIQDSIRHVLEEGCFANYVEEYNGKIEEDQRILDAKTRNDKEWSMDNVKKLAGYYEEHMLSTARQVVNIIKNLKILFSGPSFELDCIIRVLSDPDAMEACCELPSSDGSDETSSNFVRPFMYDRFVTCFKQSDLTSKLLQEVCDTYPEYAKTLAVAYALREYMDDASEDCQPLVRLSLLDPGNITKTAYLNMYTLLARALGFRKEPGVRTLLERLNTQKDSRVFVALKFTLNILFETGEIDEDMSERFGAPHRKGMKFIINLIKEELHNRGERQFDTKWIMYIQDSVDFGEWGTELTKLAMLQMLNANDERYNRFTAAASTNEIWGIIDGFDEAHEKDVIPFTRKLLACMQKVIEQREDLRAGAFRDMLPIMSSLMRRAMKGGLHNEESLSYLTTIRAVLDMAGSCEDSAGEYNEMLNALGDALKEFRNTEKFADAVRYVLVSAFDTIQEAPVILDAERLEGYFKKVFGGNVLRHAGTRTFAQEVRDIVSLEKVIDTLINDPAEELRPESRATITELLGCDISLARPEKIDYLATILRFVHKGYTTRPDFAGLQLWLNTHLPKIKNVIMEKPWLVDLEFNPNNLENEERFEDGPTSIRDGTFNIPNGKFTEAVYLKLATAMLYSRVRGMTGEEECAKFENGVRRYMNPEDITRFFPAFRGNARIGKDSTREVYTRVFINMCAVLGHLCNRPGSLLDYILTKDDGALGTIFIPFQSPSLDEKMINDCLAVLTGLIICNGRDGACHRLITIVDSACGDPGNHNPITFTCQDPACGHTSVVKTHDGGTFEVYSNWRCNHSDKTHGVQQGVARIRKASRLTRGIPTDGTEVERGDAVVREYWGDKGAASYVIMAVITALRCAYHGPEHWGNLGDKLFNCFQALATHYGATPKAGLVACVNVCREVIRVMAEADGPTTEDALYQTERELLEVFAAVDVDNSPQCIITTRSNFPLDQNVQFLKNKIESPMDSPVHSMIFGISPLQYNRMFEKDGFFSKCLVSAGGDTKMRFIGKMADIYEKTKILRSMRTYMMAMKRVTSLIREMGDSMITIANGTMDGFLRHLKNYQNNNKKMERNYTWFMENKKSILTFFRDLHKIREIQLNAVGNACGDSFHVPQYHTLKSIPVEAFLPTSKQIIRRVEGDAILGYNCGLYCIQQQNLLLDAFNESIDAAATIGQYPRIQTTKRLNYKDLNERQFVCMDMEEIVRRNIVRRHNEKFLIALDVDAATLEHELYEAVFQNAVYINENSFESTSDLDNVDFYPAFNEVGQTSDEEEDKSCLEKVQAMWKDDRESVMRLMDECMQVVFRLSRVGLGENNGNTSLSLYSRLSEEDDPSVFAILDRVRAGQLFYLYEYLEDTYGNYYIKRHLDDIFYERFGAEFTRLFRDSADKGKLIEEARMVINLVRRCLIRECIQYNRRSFQKDVMRWRDTTNIQEISFSRYYNNPETIDYKYYEYVEGGGSKNIIEYLEHLSENHGPLATIYNMYDVMRKLKKTLKEFEKRD